MQIPQVACTWADKNADELESCSFQAFFTKMEHIQEECGDSPRKQTKVETIVEGLRHCFNEAAAAKLKGMKFLLSKSGRRLHLTNLPVQVLRQMPLCAAYDAEINGSSVVQNDPFGGNNPFGGLTQKSAFGGQDNDSKRIGFASKQMLLSLLAGMDIIHAHSDNDLLILEVIDVKEKPEAVNAVVDAVFDGGEHPEGAEAFTISFGRLKDIE